MELALPLLACTAALAAVALLLLRGGSSPWAPLLVCLGSVLFLWNFASFAHARTGAIAWHVLDVAASPLTLPLALHLVLWFVGERRRWRLGLWGAYAVFGALALLGLLASVDARARRFTDSAAWGWCFLGATLAVSSFGVWLLVRHRQRAAWLERRRTDRLLAGCLLMVLAGATELVAHLGIPVPRLGGAGALLLALLLVDVALQLRVLQGEVDSVALGGAGLVAALAVLGSLGAFRFGNSHDAVLGLGALSVGATLWAVTRQLREEGLATRRRTEQLASLGRVAAQLAHDLRNPLAAAKGAAQFLKVEWERGGGGAEQASMWALLLDQLERVESALHSQLRAARVEPRPRAGDLRAWTERALAPLRQAAPPGVSLQLEQPSSLPAAWMDEELLAAALENLVRNAWEALPAGGEVRVRTRTVASGGVALEVEDTGVGMDPRVAEQALDDFFTTRAEGTGLGLGFVRRVMEALGGRVTLHSELGKGTRVTLWLRPAPPA